MAEIDDIKEKTAAMPKLMAELDAAKKLSTAQSGVHKEIVAHSTALGELTPQGGGGSEGGNDNARFRSPRPMDAEGRYVARKQAGD